MQVVLMQKMEVREYVAKWPPLLHVSSCEIAEPYASLRPGTQVRWKVKNSLRHGRAAHMVAPLARHAKPRWGCLSCP
jgi:hypothetical protein